MHCDHSQEERCVQSIMGIKRCPVKYDVQTVKCAFSTGVAALIRWQNTYTNSFCHTSEPVQILLTPTQMCKVSAL